MPGHLERDDATKKENDTMRTLWSPWERHPIECFGTVARVEILDGVALETEATASRLGSSREAVLNVALWVGLKVLSANPPNSSPAGGAR